MTTIDLTKSLFKKMYLERYKITFLLFTMSFYLFYVTSNYINRINLGIKISSFDVSCDIYNGLGILGARSFCISIIPIFIFMLVLLIDFDSKIPFLFRYKERQYIWKMQVVFIVNLAFLFSLFLIIIGYITSMIVLKNISNTWIFTYGMPYKLMNMPENWEMIKNNFMTYKVLFYVFTSCFLGLCVSGLITCILKTTMKNTMTIAIIILFNFCSLLYPEYSLYLHKMSITLRNLVYPASILINDIFLLFLTLLTYILGKNITLKKDYIS